MFRFIAITLTFTALVMLIAASAARAGGSYIEPNLNFNCQISPDTSKPVLERMFTGCGWGIGLTLKRKEEHNHHYNYEGDTTTNNNTTNNTYNKSKTKTVNKTKKIKKVTKNKTATKNKTINDNSFNPTINNPNTVHIY
jgi:hypothetical protein